MDPRSMAWRGAALLSSGTPRTEAPRADPLSDATGFRSLPPPETHEAWMGTAYARWVERDAREKLGQRRDSEVAALRLELEEERRQHAETARCLADLREQLGVVPQMQARLKRTRKLMLEYAQREAEREALGTSRAVFRECFRAWALTSSRCALDKVRNPRPDAKGPQQESARGRAPAPQQWNTLKKQMDAAVADYAEAPQASAARAEASTRVKGRAAPGYGLGATSAEEAAMSPSGGDVLAFSHGRGLELPSPREARHESPAPMTISPWYARLEDVGRPPEYDLPAPITRERPPPSRGGLGLVFDNSVQRTVPAPSTGCLLRDRTIRWIDLPEPQSSR